MTGERAVAETRAGSTTVTRDEFESFTAHVETRFAAVAAGIDRLADKIDGMNQPKYGVWISAGSLLVAVMALGGALVANTVSSESKLSEARDVHQREMIDVLANGSNRYTREDHDAFEAKIADALLRVDEDAEDNRDRIARNTADLARIDATLVGFMDAYKQAGPGLSDTREKLSELKAHVDELRDQMRSRANQP